MADVAAGRTGGLREGRCMIGMMCLPAKSALALGTEPSSGDALLALRWHNETKQLSNKG